MDTITQNADPTPSASVLNAPRLFRTTCAQAGKVNLGTSAAQTMDAKTLQKQADLHATTLMETFNKVYFGLHHGDTAKERAFNLGIHQLHQYVRDDVPVRPHHLTGSAWDPIEPRQVGAHMDFLLTIMDRRYDEHCTPELIETCARLFSSYAVHGYLSLYEADKPQRIKHISEGYGNMVSPMYLHQAVVRKNPLIAASLIRAGADWTKVPVCDVTREGVKGFTTPTVPPVYRHDFMGLVHEFIDAAGVAIIQGAIQARLAMSMSDAIQTSERQTSERQGSEHQGSEHQASKEAPTTSTSLRRRRAL